MRHLMDSMELEPSQNVSLPGQDRRPLMPQPLPVRLVTVDDAELVSPAGLEKQLDDFYVTMLKFEREPLDTAPGANKPPAPDHTIVYRADNFRLRFHIFERTPPRDSVRP